MTGKSDPLQPLRKMLRDPKIQRSWILGGDFHLLDILEHISYNIIISHLNN